MSARHGFATVLGEGRGHRTKAASPPPVRPKGDRLAPLLRLIDRHVLDGQALSDGTLLDFGEAVVDLIEHGGDLDVAVTVASSLTDLRDGCEMLHFGRQQSQTSVESREEVVQLMGQLTALDALAETLIARMARRAGRATA